jgi:hypothetical protein
VTDPSRTEICSRAWEVAAARDGRLLSKDVDSQRRHLATCEDCSEEAQRLEALSLGLRNLPPLPDDLLAARRLRHRLLADTNQWVTGNVPAQPRPTRAIVLGALAVGVLSVLGYVAFSRHAAHLPLATTNVNASGQAEHVQAQISAGKGSVWRKSLLGEELRIELNTGEISAKIGPRRPGQAVRILLPDGVIEDLGTVLSVRVENQRTTSIREVACGCGSAGKRRSSSAPAKVGRERSTSTATRRRLRRCPNPLPWASATLFRRRIPLRRRPLAPQLPALQQCLAAAQPPRRM